jgi:hypothetical protein
VFGRSVWAEWRMRLLIGLAIAGSGDRSSAYLIFLKSSAGLAVGATMTPGSSTLLVPGDKSYAGQGTGRADRNRRPYLKDLPPQRRRGQAAGCVECSDILARIPHRSLEDPEGWIRCHSAETGAWMHTNREQHQSRISAPGECPNCGVGH